MAADYGLPGTDATSSENFMVTTGYEANKQALAQSLVGLSSTHGQAAANAVVEAGVVAPPTEEPLVAEPISVQLPNETVLATPVSEVTAAQPASEVPQPKYMPKEGETHNFIRLTEEWLTPAEYQEAAAAKAEMAADAANFDSEAGQKWFKLYDEAMRRMLEARDGGKATSNPETAQAARAALDEMIAARGMKIEVPSSGGKVELYSITNDGSQGKKLEQSLADAVAKDPLFATQLERFVQAQNKETLAKETQASRKERPSIWSKIYNFAAEASKGLTDWIMAKKERAEEKAKLANPEVAAKVEEATQRGQVGIMERLRNLFKEDRSMQMLRQAQATRIIREKLAENTVRLAFQRMDRLDIARPTTAKGRTHLAIHLRDVGMTEQRITEALSYKDDYEESILDLRQDINGLNQEIRDKAEAIKALRSTEDFEAGRANSEWMEKVTGEDSAQVDRLAKQRQNLQIRLKMEEDKLQEETRELAHYREQQSGQLGAPWKPPIPNSNPDEVSAWEAAGKPGFEVAQLAPAPAGGVILPATAQELELTTQQNAPTPVAPVAAETVGAATNG
jgi:hypothetical protein